MDALQIDLLPHRRGLRLRRRAGLGLQLAAALLLAGLCLLPGRWALQRARAPSSETQQLAQQLAQARQQLHDAQQRADALARQADSQARRDRALRLLRLLRGSDGVVLRQWVQRGDAIRLQLAASSPQPLLELRQRLRAAGEPRVGWLGWDAADGDTLCLAPRCDDIDGGDGT